MQPHPSTCHRHAMELPETLFINVPGNTVFSFSPFLFYFFSFKKKIGTYDPDLARGGLDLARGGYETAINDPYQYKNRGQNFLLTGRAASQGSSMAWRRGGAALMRLMVFNVCREVLTS